MKAVKIQSNSNAQISHYITPRVTEEYRIPEMQIHCANLIYEEFRNVDNGTVWKWHNLTINVAPLLSPDITCQDR